MNETLVSCGLLSYKKLMSMLRKVGFLKNEIYGMISVYSFCLWGLQNDHLTYFSFLIGGSLFKPTLSS